MENKIPPELDGFVGNFFDRVEQMCTQAALTLKGEDGQAAVAVRELIATTLRLFDSHSLTGDNDQFAKRISIVSKGLSSALGLMAAVVAMGKDDEEKRLEYYILLSKDADRFAKFMAKGMHQFVDDVKKQDAETRQ